MKLLREALLQAKEGRLHILNEMKKTISAPRADLKPQTPRAETVIIEKDMIGAVIGPGGKVVQDIQNTTGATVSIEEVGNKGVGEGICDKQGSYGSCFATGSRALLPFRK